MTNNTNNNSFKTSSQSRDKINANTKTEFDQKLKELIQQKEFMTQFQARLDSAHKNAEIPINSSQHDLTNFSTYTPQNYPEIHHALIALYISGNMSKEEFRYLFSINKKNKNAWLKIIRAKKSK